MRPLYIYIYLTSITTSSNILWIIYVSVYYVEIIEPSNTIGSNAFIYIFSTSIYICILYIRLFIIRFRISYIYNSTFFVTTRANFSLFSRVLYSNIYSNFDIILIYIFTIVIIAIIIVFVVGSVQKMKAFELIFPW